MRFPRYAAAARRPMGERMPSVKAPALHRQRADDRPAKSADPLARDAVLAAVEALLMLADEPLPAKKLAAAAGLADAAAAIAQIGRLRQLYDDGESPFTVAEIAGGFRLLTRPAYHPWLLRLRRTGHELRLTAAAMETLAVIAYKQPVMRAEVEAIRGVACGDLIQVLMEKGLVRIAGRHDSLGRPQLFGTTKAFLQHFGMNDLTDLPQVGSLKPPPPR